MAPSRDNRCPTSAFPDRSVTLHMRLGDRSREDRVGAGIHSVVAKHPGRTGQEISYGVPFIPLFYIDSDSYTQNASSTLYSIFSTEHSDQSGLYAAQIPYVLLERVAGQRSEQFSHSSERKLTRQRMRQYLFFTARLTRVRFFNRNHPSYNIPNP